jgi:RNA polymerase sigma factor (sigma-70 family)
VNDDEDFYRRTTPGLLHFAIGRFDVPPEDAEDIVQEAMLGYLLKTGVLNPRAYLVKAVIHGCLSYWRRSTRRTFVPMDEKYLPAVPPPSHVARLTTAAILRRLSERDRRIVTLRYLHGCKVREIGVALGVSHSRTEKLLRRAIERAKRAASSTEDVENRGSKGRPLRRTDTYLTLEYGSRCRCKEPRWTKTSSSRRSALSSTTRWRKGSTSISRTSSTRPASSSWTSGAWSPAARM